MLRTRFWDTFLEDFRVLLREVELIFNQKHFIHGFLDMVFYGLRFVEKSRDGKWTESNSDEGG